MIPSSISILLPLEYIIIWWFYTYTIAIYLIYSGCHFFLKMTKSDKKGTPRICRICIFPRNVTEKQLSPLLVLGVLLINVFFGWNFSEPLKTAKNLKKMPQIYEFCTLCTPMYFLYHFCTFCIRGVYAKKGSVWRFVIDIGVQKSIFGSF